MKLQSLFDRALEIVLQRRQPSISLLQHELKIDYRLAAALIEEMEILGIVSPVSSTGKRVIASAWGSTSRWRRLLGVGWQRPGATDSDTTLSEVAIARLAAAEARIARSAAPEADDEFADGEEEIGEAEDSPDSGPAKIDDSPGPPVSRRGEKSPLPPARRNEPFPQRQRLRDARGNVYGYLDYRDDGANARLLLKDARYTILGFYDLTNDVTRDARGSLVGRGNQLMLLASHLAPTALR